MDCGCEASCEVCRLADEVIIEGKYGTGQERKDSLVMIIMKSKMKLIED